MTAATTRAPAGKEPLLVATGRAIRARRGALGVDPKQIVAAIGLSPSYFRSIEAGSLAPPPGIAIPLAAVLEWNAGAMSELLCALAYLGTDEDDKRRRLLARSKEVFAHGVATPIMNLVDQEPLLVDAIGSFLSTAGETGRALPGQSAAGPAIRSTNLPWMFDIAINRMVEEMSAAQFTIDKTFSTKFVSKHAQSISNMRALLSYVPNGTLFEESGYDFSFLGNDLNPTFWIKFVGRGLAKIVKPDLISTLARLAAGPDRHLSKAKLRADLEKRVVVQTVDEFSLVFDPVNRSLEIEEAAGRYRQAFCNAWLYEVEQAGRTQWVGFIDTFQDLDEGFEIVPLSLSQVEQINATFFKSS